jgi:hypothetical protein
VTKNIAIIVINLVTPKGAAKRELLFNKPVTVDRSRLSASVVSSADFKGQRPEAVFLIVCDPSMNEL